MRLSGPGFLWGVPVLGGLFSLVTVVILARVGGRLLGDRAALAARGRLMVADGQLSLVSRLCRNRNGHSPRI